MTRETWLTPFWDDWITRFGGDPPGGVLAKTLRPLVKRHGEETVRAAWRRFLTDQNPAYVSIPKFGMTFGAWAGEKPRNLGRADRARLEAQEWGADADTD